MSEAVAPRAQWYYFKFLMNGRHIASLGVSAAKARGQVMRGLFDPSDIWNYVLDGTAYKNCGIEQRPFYFADEEGFELGCSVAGDGGLLEVRVHRAKGRQRRMADPIEYRPQDEYGIV